MIKISFAAGMVTVVVGWILFRFAAFLKNKKVDWKFEAKQIFFLINLAVIVRITFYPFATVNGQVQPLILELDAVWPFRINWIPLVNLLDYDNKFDLLINIIGNSTMFIPTGIMLPLIYRNIDGLKRVVLTGLAISLAIELIQLPFAVRASDVDDLLLNTAGCLTGFGILSICRCLKKQIQAKRNKAV